MEDVGKRHIHETENVINIWENKMCKKSVSINLRPAGLALLMAGTMLTSAPVTNVFAAGEDKNLQIEEVIVTARKRSESLQVVPIA